MARFEWDESKARINERKHGVHFQDAVKVFSDPFALNEQDREERGELRWQTLGLIGSLVVLLVAHTTLDDANDETIRIISARKASPQERERYEQNRQSWLPGQ